MEQVAAVAVRQSTDLTGRPAADRASVLAAFDSLAPGESLELRGDPGGLLLQFQADRKGQFEWSPLEAGPARFRTLVTRRIGGAGTLREVNEALSWDHDRLEAIERHAFELLGLGERDAARAAWAEFSVGLRRHIRFEEELLFPTFEEKMGMPPDAGPTEVMRIEHRQIEELIDGIARALEQDGDAVGLRRALQQVLGQHNMKEERVLYPGTDQALTAEERDALVARIQTS